jgi:hypothetical protein
MTETINSSLPTTPRTPSYTIYKPNSHGNGGAISFSLNRNKGAVFIEAANQSGERQFDWENKIIMKWGLSDLGSILAGLQNRNPQTKLFHQTEKANSACGLSFRGDSEKAPFLLSVSRQSSSDKQVRKVAVTLTESESSVLETALKTAINRILGW